MSCLFCHLLLSYQNTSHLVMSPSAAAKVAALVDTYTPASSLECYVPFCSLLLTLKIFSIEKFPLAGPQHCDQISCFVASQCSRSIAVTLPSNIFFDQVEYTPNLLFLGKTGFDGTRAIIHVKKLHPQSVWITRSVQHLLGTLLHGMTPACVALTGCDRPTCRCLANIRRTHGVTGHGPSWVRPCEAMKAEVHRGASIAETVSMYKKA